MKRAWIGVAILSASWMFGLSYYYAAQWIVWAIALAAAIPFLMYAVRIVPSRNIALIAIVLLAPMIVAAPWPYRAAAILIAIGLAIGALQITDRWTGRLGSGFSLAGVILLAQSVAMVGYESFTARFPDLPGPLTKLMGALGRMVGIDVAAHGSDLSMFTMRQVHR
ncbi:MAG: hypothetical protein QGG25_10585, partial [Phycisphaerae bacterium]|nr:hypothetical protein [Phycisphaerae bacterium]